MNDEPARMGVDISAAREPKSLKSRPRGGILQLKLASIAFLSYGFRPFFVGAAVWAVLAMMLWIGLMTGRLSFASQYGTAAWHAHEFLLGYGAAVVAGFLLTAIPNWTGRLPVRDTALLALFLLWAAGRIAFLASDSLGPHIAASIDSGFLFVLACVVLREIIAGRNWRNLPITGLVLLLGFGNVTFHAEVLFAGVPAYGVRIVLAAIVSIIMLVGGRITPSFTRNWLVRQHSDKLPASFGRFDVVALAVAAVGLLAWITAPVSMLTGAMLAVAAVAQALRLARWAGERTAREPLVLILHVGYAFVALGFTTLAISIFWPSILPPGDALHAWTVGAVGVMTLAVMTRATLGHTGRDLAATTTTHVIYVAIVLAALTRLTATLFSSYVTAILTFSAAAWITAFGLFTLRYGPMLLAARLERRF